MTCLKRREARTDRQFKKVKGTRKRERELRERAIDRKIERQTERKRETLKERVTEITKNE